MAKPQVQNRSNTQELSNQIALLEQQLVEQQAHFHHFVEDIGDGYWRWNILSKELYLSPGLLNFLEYQSDSERLSALSWSDILSTDDQEKIGQITNQLEASNHISFTIDLDLTVFSGERKAVNCRGSVTEWDDTDKPKIISGLFSEIIHQPKPEAANIQPINGFEQQLAALVEQAPVAMAVFDTQMRYIAASKNWVEVYKVNEKSIIGRSHYEVSPEITDEWKEIYQDSLKGNTNRKEEDRFIRDDGSEQWIRWEVRPWYIANNQIGGLTMMTEDITERKNSELALQLYQQGLKILTHISANNQLSLEEKLQEVLLSVANYFDLPLGIISHVEGSEYTIEYAISIEDDMSLEAGTVFQFNNTYCSITYDRDDSVAIPYMRNSDYASHPCYDEFRLESYIGSPIWVGGKKYGTINFSSPEQRLNPFSENDIDFMRLVARWVGTTLERHVNEKQLIAAREQAEEATQAKTDFLSTMSHEIRTPMNAVVGMAHLLLEENPRLDQMKSLETLKFSADLLLSLINDILDFSKIEAGKIVLESIDFNLKDMLQGIRAAQSIKAQEKQVKLKLRWDEDVPEMVVGDAVRLGQIINNLVSNAVKFTSEGEVAIEVELINEIDESATLSFKVKDTGIGISEEQINAIFEEFSQASSSTTRKFGGTGLGLAITKKLLELQGSQIEVTSEIGAGSTFSFELALTKSKKKPSREVSNVDNHNNSYIGSLNGMKILLVEDNLVNQYVAARFMKKWNADLDTANHGGEALEKAQEKTYDIILMDLQMPVVDGYQATRNIREWETQTGRSPVPIIALTASATLSTKGKVISMGMNDFVTKPFDPNELFSRLQYHGSSTNEQEGEDSTAGGEPENNGESNVEVTVNLEILKFLTTNDPDQEEELREKLKMQFEQLICDVRDFQKTADSEKLHSHLHRVKSVLTTFEIEPLGQIVRDILEKGRIEDINDYPHFVTYCENLVDLISN